ncbi:MAG: hypothetical protein E6G92_03270 [Alphaproteobacteria bacterium]|nr:MAG: hypothetical protein E6G92_03270 [Alphaproteobacteria bacterium]
MTGKLSVFAARSTFAACTAILLVMTPCAAAPQQPDMPPIPTPFPSPDFHFSDPARDAQYWRLEREVAQSHAAFGRSVDVARRAIYPDRARPSVPVAPGTSAWLEARAAVEQAIRDRRLTRDAIARLDAFLTRERRQLGPAEAEYALDVRHVRQGVLLATSDHLVDLLASLAGIRIGQWPP